MLRALIVGIACSALANGALAAEEKTSEKLAQKEIPKIVLHDILTNRVCIFESKLYSIGSKVVILDEVHECTNANSMTFGSADDKWDMRWIAVEK
jgi:hypothetical protein